MNIQTTLTYRVGQNPLCEYFVTVPNLMLVIIGSTHLYGSLWHLKFPLSVID
jgi:hypothetical protein